MPPLNIALCTYSYGLGNGIAHMDAALAQGLDPARFRMVTYVLRSDFPPGRRSRMADALHISLADAYEFLSDAFRGADVVHVNGALDPVAANAAAAAGVPAVVEVMHQVETGGLHPAVDAVVCVSELVRSVQSHTNVLIIHNGIDTGRFAFVPGRRDPAAVSIVQVANASRQIHRELGDMLPHLDGLNIRASMAGDRPPLPGVLSLGVVREMPSVYHGADLLFLLGKMNAFGLVFAEAMACGTLPVTSGDSGATAFILPGKTGWVVEEPGETRNVVRVLREAVEAVSSPKFVAMQRRARELIVRKFGRPRMLEAYQALYGALGKRPRKKPQPAEAWKDLALFAVLVRHGHNEALEPLASFNRGDAPLEPYFLRHPMGNATLTAALRACPALADQGHGALVAGFCRRLRASRIVTPFLDTLEQRVK